MVMVEAPRLGPSTSVRARLAARLMARAVAPPTGLRQGVTHLAGRAVAEIAHRVERLFGAPGSDQQRFALQIVANAERLENSLRDGFDRRQASRARHPARQVAFIGIENPDAAHAQCFQILLRSGIFPHVDVHRRRHHDGRLSGDCERREKVVRDAVRELGDDVRRRGRDDQGINRLRHRDVLDSTLQVGVLGLTPEHFGDDLAAGERGKGERRDEFARAARHHHLNLQAALLKQAHELGGFVRRDPARYSQSHPHVDFQPASRRAQW